MRKVVCGEGGRVQDGVGLRAESIPVCCLSRFAENPVTLRSSVFIKRALEACKGFDVEGWCY